MPIHSIGQSSSTTYQMYELPNELLVFVFSKLKPTDTFSASQVCKKWTRVTIETEKIKYLSLLKRLEIVAKKYNQPILPDIKKTRIELSFVGNLKEIRAIGKQLQIRINPYLECIDFDDKEFSYEYSLELKDIPKNWLIESLQPVYQNTVYQAFKVLFFQYCSSRDNADLKNYFSKIAFNSHCENGSIEWMYELALHCLNTYMIVETVIDEDLKELKNLNFFQEELNYEDILKNWNQRVTNKMKEQVDPNLFEIFRNCLCNEGRCQFLLLWAAEFDIVPSQFDAGFQKYIKTSPEAQRSLSLFHP